MKLEKIGVDKVEGVHLAKGTYSTNYIEFMRTFELTGNKIEATFNTPARKSLNKVFNNSFEPYEILIEKEIKITVKWKRK